MFLNTTRLTTFLYVEVIFFFINNVCKTHMKCLRQFRALLLHVNTHVCVFLYRMLECRWRGADFVDDRTSVTAQKWLGERKYKRAEDKNLLTVFRRSNILKHCNCRVVACSSIMVKVDYVPMLLYEHIVARGLTYMHVKI